MRRSDRGSSDRSGRVRAIALTGTPGTGKSRVALLLRDRWDVEEAADLALRAGAGRRLARGTEVDIAPLSRRMRSRSLPLPELVVGHLAHLLPVSGAVVLRCRPDVLRARLARAGRGTRSERQSNFVAEAVDLVLREALDRGLVVWELDTTDRRPQEIAREVDRLLRERPPAKRIPVDWLADPRVTAHLLDPTS